MSIMKRGKKLVGMILTLIMVIAMAIPTCAANSNAHTITITNEQARHTYSAYQVFAGDISNGKLTNIEWGAGVDGAALLAELKTLSAYASCTTAEDVADVLAGFANDSVALDAFAKKVGEHLSTTVAGTSTELGTENTSTYTISVTGDGYYFVKDTGKIGTNDAATKYILKVVENVTVEAKADIPDIDKVIVNADSANGGEGKGTAQDVGSVVNFKLTSTVPEMDGYDTYTYIVNDTLSTGLTAVDEDDDDDGKIDVAVTIGGVAYTDFIVAQNGQSFTITFNNFIDQKENAGAAIVITYSATINENALTTDVETNTVNLEYSNNPNDNTSKGKTPDKIVYVYDFDIVIDKYTKENTTEKRLADAMFVLKNSEGKYYYWDATNNKVEWKTVESEPDATDKTADDIKKAWEDLGVTVVTTDVNGAAKFWGLDSGTYSLKEVAAPAGYNLLKEEVEVVITATYNDDGTLATSSATSTNKGQYSQTQKIENKSGVTLPSTGGMGTTIFYLLGAALVLIAAVLLIVRKRMSVDK